LAPALTRRRKNTVSIPQVKDNKKAAIDILPPLTFARPFSPHGAQSSLQPALVAIASLEVSYYFAGMRFLDLFKIAQSLQFFAAAAGWRTSLAHAKRL
jgi:hypothetical protein